MGRKSTWLYVLTLNLFILDLVIYIIRMMKGSTDGLVKVNHTLFSIYYIFFLIVLFYLLINGKKGINLLPSTFVIVYFSIFLLLVGAELQGILSQGIANTVSLILEPAFDLFMIIFALVILYRK